MAEEARHRLRTASLVLLAISATAAGLYFGREFFVPIVFAFLLNALFRPAVKGLVRARVPVPVGAALVVLALTVGLVALGIMVKGPLQNFGADASKTLDAAQGKLERLRRPVQKFNETAMKIQQAAGAAPATSTSQPTSREASDPPAQPPNAIPTPVAPDLAGQFFNTTTRLVGALAEVLLLLYLLLASGDLFLHKLVKVMPMAREKRTAIEVANEAQDVVERYLWVTLLINLGQGAIVAVAMWLLGLGHPLMWGMATVVLEFVPYLGATVMIAALLIASAATRDTFWQMLAPPLAYLVITTIQNNVVSPFAYGQRLKLNPVAVLIGVLVWWFLWGIAGAFLAVPIIATVKIVAERTEGLKAVGEFLGE